MAPLVLTDEALGDRTHDLPFTGGVFGGLLPPAFGGSVDTGTPPTVRYLR